MSKSPTYVGSRPMGTAPHHTYGNPPCLQAGFRVISWKPTLLEVRPLIPEHLRVVGRWSGDFLPAPPRWLHKRSVLRSASFIFVFEHVSHQLVILETTAKQLNPMVFFLFCFFSRISSGKQKHRQHILSPYLTLPANFWRTKFLFWFNSSHFL